MSKKPKREIDPVNLYGHALQICKSADYLLRGKDDELTPSAIILLALVCELLFKCIIAIEENKFSDTHLLHVLFRQISHKGKLRIEQLWDSYARPRLQFLPIQRNGRQ